MLYIIYTCLFVLIVSESLAVVIGFAVEHLLAFLCTVSMTSQTCCLIYCVYCNWFTIDKYSFIFVHLVKPTYQCNKPWNDVLMNLQIL